MPPPQPFLASRIRGYVCRSCLLKLQSPRNQRTPWLSRNVTNDNGPSRSKRERTSLLHDESTFRVFETPIDGPRNEMHDDAEDESFLEELDSTIRELREQTGKSANTLTEPTEDDEDDFSNDPAEFLEGIPHASINPRILEAIDSANEVFEAQVRKLGSTSRISDTRSTINDAPSPERESLRPNRHNSASDVDQTLMKPLITTNVHSGIDIPIAQFPRAYQKKIQNFKSSLHQALVGSRQRRSSRPKFNDSKYRADLWKNYLLCRAGLLSNPKKIPPEMWIGLWKTFEADHVKNLDRMAHLKVVGDDMRVASVDMGLSQRLLHIESCFIQGDQSRAIGYWEEIKQASLYSTSIFKAYWELGIRMLCRTGQVDAAMQAAETLLQASDDPTICRILIPIIRAYLALEEGTGIQHAWALYIRLRVNLGDAIKMEDYDSVTSMFLGADQPDLALGVFKDMMLTGDAAVAQHDSTQSFRNAVGTDDDFKMIKFGEGELNWKKSRTLAKLPAKFNNKFFFGSWVKKLIGEGELSSAKKVFDLMQEWGIRPSPIQTNGLIGAWFRDGTEKSRILAEDTAWRMIKARTDFVRERELRYDLDGPIRAVQSFGMPDSKSTFFTPFATIETFTVLLQQYRRRQKTELASDLFEALKTARIPPNTCFINELLWMDTRAHSRGRVWKTYTSLKDENSFSPDIETYTILWQNMKKQVDPVIGKKSAANFTTCQLLFAEMAQRAPDLLRKDTFPRELYELIVLCFSYEQDQPGTAVALRALQRHFNMFPSEVTARTIVLQLSRLGLVNEWGEKPVRLNLSSGQTRERVASVTKVLQMFKTQRVEALLQQGIVFEELKSEARLEETLVLLSDLLRYTHQVRNAGKEATTAYHVSRKTAITMGVPDCIPWEASEKD